MRAVQLIAPNRPLAEANLPDVAPGAGEIKIAIRACGICHSDAHYRAGFGNVEVPRTLGHEIAGVVSEIGAGVTELREGDRVAVHYLLTCGTCDRCKRGGEQFCVRGRMIGKQSDGGYAESIVIPAWNAIPVPDAVPLDVAAVMMCSTATAYHALHLANLREGESVLLLGFGGLGISALELAFALGASAVGVVDVVPEKLAKAREMGAVAFDGSSLDFADFSADIALDFVGRAPLSTAALRSLAPGGRLVVVALSEAPLDFNPYRDLLAPERHILGASDHLREELFALIALAAGGKIRIDRAISRRVALEAGAIDAVLDELHRGTAALRSVIVSS